jgi:dipeptidyl aminopeptidase/acylaminoacyl peptidase
MMRSALLAVGLFAVASISFADDPPPPAAPAHIPAPGADVFGALPFLRHPQLSPDGTYFACIQTMKGRPVVIINKIGDTSGKWPVALPIPDMVIDSFVWAKNDRLILRLKWSHTHNGQMETFYHYVAVTADGATATPLAEEKASSASVTTEFRAKVNMVGIVDVAHDDPTNIYAHMSDGGLARIDITTGQVRSNYDPNFGKDRIVRKWITDGHGNPVARIDQTRNPLIDHLMIKDGDSWTEVTNGSAYAEHGIFAAALTTDGKAVAVYSDDQTPYVTIDRIELAPDHARSHLFEAGKYDVFSLLCDGRTSRATGVMWIEDSPKIAYFDPELASILRGLQSQFPGRNIEIVSTDLARTKVFFRISSATEPNVYLYLNRTTHVAKPIGWTYPGLRNVDFGTLKPYPFTARDGLAIPAYLTLPPGKEAKNLPLLVMPSDGGRYDDDYDAWRSFFTAHGYAVFETNQRGSYGYGLAFMNAGKKQWGLKIQDDVTDGVKKLIADGIADRKRICIVGEGFGGLTALAGAAFTPNLYACAVSINGISDLPRAAKLVSEDYGRYSRIWSTVTEWIGDPSADAAQLAATSPAFHADKITVPVLLIHSTGYTGIRIEQSETMEKALKHAGKPVEFVRIEGYDGDFDTAETRIRAMTEAERFIAKAIGN